MHDTTPHTASPAPDLTPQRPDIGMHNPIAASSGSPHFSQMDAYRYAPSPIHAPENRTGLPDRLKAGVESLSGMDISDVTVHYNSSRPTQLNALAYAQGSDIHLASGQERHLPHEAWHVVQQKQGRVAATRQMKGYGVNDDQALEREADIMGERALRSGPQSSLAAGYGPTQYGAMQMRCKDCDEKKPVQKKTSDTAPIQLAACQGTQHDTSNQHRLIELDYMNNINPNAAREYQLPEGSVLLEDDGVTHKTGYVDIADQAAHELYEIKRADEQYPEAQLNQYLAAANTHCGGGWTRGAYYPSERIINYSAYEANTELIARKDPRPGFIRYEKRAIGGGLGIAAAFGGGIYVNGMANAANLPPVGDWMQIWTQQIFDASNAPESIDIASQGYTNAVGALQGVVTNVSRSLRGGTLDKDLLTTGWGQMSRIVDQAGL